MSQVLFRQAGDTTEIGAVIVTKIENKSAGTRRVVPGLGT